MQVFYTCTSKDSTIKYVSECVCGGGKFFGKIMEKWAELYIGKLNLGEKKQLGGIHLCKLSGEHGLPL